MGIHALAQVHPTAELGEGVEVGPFAVIGEKVCLGDRTILQAHAIVQGHTIIGRECEIYSGAILGGAPQDARYRGEETYVIIGDGNVIREFVTIHRASGEGQATRVGDHNLLMAYTHIGHNCVVGSHVNIANSTGVSGYTVIEDYVFIGGMAGFHQKVRVGKMAMVGGFSRIVQDVPPFMLVEGVDPVRVQGINQVGLKRRGFSAELREQLRQAYRLLYRSELNTSQALAEIRATIPGSPELEYLLEFIGKIPEGRFGRQLDRIE